MGQAEGKLSNAKEYFLHQSLQKRKLERQYRHAGNKEAMEALLNDMLQEQWLKIFFSAKYEFRIWSVDGNQLRTDEGKPVKEHVGERSRWDEFAYAIQQQKDTPHLADLKQQARQHLLEALHYFVKDKRWKLLLWLYLDSRDIPLECLSSNEKLDEMLLDILYNEFESEVKHSDPVVL